DGLQIVPKNWRINDLTFYYPIGLKNSKLYDNLVSKMADPNVKCKGNYTFVWTPLTIIKIYGSDDDFINAKHKLKTAENFTDVNTDDDIKTQRHTHAKKKYSSSDDEESQSFFHLSSQKKKNASNLKKKKNNEDNDTNKIFSQSMFDSFPTLHNTIKSADILQNEMSSDLPTFENNMFSTTRHNTSKDFQLLMTSTYGAVVKSPIKTTNITTIDTEFINENEFIRTSTQIDEMIKTPVKTITNASSMLRNALDMTFMTSPGNIDLNLNKQTIQQSDDHFFNKSAIITTNELDKKVEHLTNYTAEIKLKVDKILLNQERILNFLRRQQIGEPSNAQSEEFDEHFEKYYPLNKVEDFLHVTELLKNENYYKLLRTKLLIYGGSDISSAIKIILTKVISNQLGTKITLTGLSAGRRPAPDEKLGFLKTKFFGLLLDVLKNSFPNITEELMKKPISSWLK
ncbi:Uncharacterized protein FWK35_00031066, partial [Aphis craccivora]